MGLFLFFCLGSLFVYVGGGSLAFFWVVGVGLEERWGDFGFLGGAGGFEEVVEIFF